MPTPPWLIIMANNKGGRKFWNNGWKNVNHCRLQPHNWAGLNTSRFLRKIC
jgi:hypothetical protein